MTPRRQQQLIMSHFKSIIHASLILFMTRNHMYNDDDDDNDDIPLGILSFCFPVLSEYQLKDALR